MGSQKFLIDRHPQREQILEDIAKHMSDQQIADKYGMNRITVLRYRNNPANKLAKIRAVEEVYRKTVAGLAQTLVDKAARLSRMQDAIEEKILDTEGKLRDGDYKELHDAMRVYMQAQETFGKHLIRLENLGFGITQSHNREKLEQETDTLINVILEALDPFPDARKAVIEAVKSSREIPE